MPESTQEYIDGLIAYIDEAIERASVSNRHVAAVLDYLNRRLKALPEIATHFALDENHNIRFDDHEMAYLSDLSDYLRKNAPDSAVALIGFLAGATFGTFTSDLLGGTGARIDENGNAEFESVRVRSVFQAAELVVNRMSAIEGDQLLTESDIIDRVVYISGSSYGLFLRSKYDGYFTAQSAGAVIKGMVSSLASAAVGVASGSEQDQYTSWMRINSVNPTLNYIEVTLYPDNETPAGQNFPPCALMKIARWGHQSDTTRQGCIYLSSTEGRIVHLSGVTRPIIDRSNYAASFGRLPDFVASITQRDGSPLPLRENLDYVYIGGLIVQDIIRIDFQGRPICEYVDRGEWQNDGLYYFEKKNPATGVWEISDVWYLGCKWRCCANLTSAVPRWDSTDWVMLEGNPAFTVDFEETDILFDPDNFFVTLTIIAMLYNQDITSDILASDVVWTRYSEDASGVERVASDNAWALRRAGAGKSMSLTFADVDKDSDMPRTLRFTATVTLRDGQGNSRGVASQSFVYR